MANNTRRNLRTPNPVIPGRAVDIQIGGDDPAIRDLYKRLGDLQVTATQLGSVITPVGGFTVDDVLVYDGTNWVAVDKTALLSLDNLTDVAISSPAAAQLLRYSGAAWLNAAVTLDDLADVIVTAPANKHVLRYNGSNWVNVSSVDMLALTELSDVTISAVATGQFLVKTSGDWKNQSFSSGNLALGTSFASTHRLFMFDTNHSGWFTGSSFAPNSASAGYNMAKIATDTTHTLTLNFRSGTAACWDLGMAADTSNAFRTGEGNADLFLYDHSVPGECLRISPEEAASGGTGTKFLFGRNAATPRAETGFVTMVSPANGLSTLVLRQKAGQTASGTEWRDSSDVALLSVAAAGHLTFAEAVNVVLGTTTGTKFGTSALQKLSFWNATPVVQPAAYTVANPTTDRALDVTGDTLAQGLAVLGTLISDLKSVGLLG